MLTCLSSDYSVLEYITAHWSELFPEHPIANDLSLELGYAVLTSVVHESMRDLHSCWHWVVLAMKEPEELEQVISLLSTPTFQASFVEYYPELTPSLHDPLLIACHCAYRNVMEYIVRTAPPDVLRFNEVLRVSASSSYMQNDPIKWINMRPDMQVNSDGVAVAVDPDGGEGEVEGKSFVYLFVG